MCTGRTHVRICLEAHADLLELIEATERAENAGHIKRWWSGETLTASDMMKRLIDRAFEHKIRSARSRRNRTKRSKATRSVTPLTEPTENELAGGDYDLVEPDIEEMRRGGKAFRDWIQDKATS